MVFTITFYSPILPLPILYAIISLICNYWIDKLKIIKRTTIKTSINNNLAVKYFLLIINSWR